VRGDRRVHDRSGERFRGQHGARERGKLRKTYDQTPVVFLGLIFTASTFERLNKLVQIASIERNLVGETGVEQRSDD